MKKKYEHKFTLKITQKVVEKRDMRAMGCHGVSFNPTLLIPTLS
jgi:hypothetical protein